MLKRGILAVCVAIVINCIYGNLIPINGYTIVLLLVLGNYGILFILLYLLLIWYFINATKNNIISKMKVVEIWKEFL